MSIKSFFFEESKDEKKEQPKPEPVYNEPLVSFTRKAPENTEVSFTPVKSTTVLDKQETEKFFQHFDTVIAGSNLSGSNYSTFSKMLEEMGDIPETSRYKAAFAALKVQGVTKSNLVNTANSFITLLDSDNTGFKLAVEQSTKDHNDQVQALEKSISDAQQAIKDIKASTEAEIVRIQKICDDKIMQLENQITNNRDKIGPLREEKEKMLSKISTYDTACQQYKSSIQNDINKINSFIQ